MISKSDSRGEGQTFGERDVKFPWVTYWLNEGRGYRVDAQLTWPVLFELLNNVPSDQLRENSLPFLAEIPKKDRFDALRKLAELEDDLPLMTALVLLTKIGFHYPTPLDQMVKRRESVQKPEEPTLQEMFWRSRASRSKRLDDEAPPRELTDKEKMDAALASSGGHYWWKGSGKGWDGQWHRAT